MRATGALVLVLFATDALVGQQVSQVMQFEDVLAAMAERGLELPADGERPIERVARLVQALIQAEASTVNRAHRPRTRVVPTRSKASCSCPARSRSRIWSPASTSSSATRSGAGSWCSARC
jgi:hypothetical protein